ncbi:NlpC/P60 family protein [Streptomyces sp. JJ36]|uniref:C40 family peptidase n=1 Tax=Streptomyces sp. JJ36 TaxID=2736645 RepID=UPI001F3BB773|nr:NlpC/P60 family protein [Streptomyces sp. JJ36]MCF6524668.1 C40 family peptidase [Streptomyces sp. JJ36]
MTRRTVSTAAATLATAVLLAAHPAHTAEAPRPGLPAPGSHRSPADPAASPEPVEPGGPGNPPTTGAPTAPANPGAPGEPAADAPLDELLTELRTRYRRAEAATEAYHAAEQRLRTQRAEVDRLRKRLARTRDALSAGREAAGRLARRQYRGEIPGVPPAVRLLFADDPMSALHHGHALERAAVRQNAAVRRLASGERHRNALVERERQALRKKRELARQRRERRDAAREELRRVEELLTSLDDDRLAQLRALESARRADSPGAFPHSGPPGDGTGTRAPSAQGEQALTHALEQLGTEYTEGAEGPGDGSAFVARAWRHAGRSLPRTSVRQWRRLHRVLLDEVRPGDLVLYHPKAGRVALYAGHGLVVHAPRPGGRVTLAPVADDPPLGAVRPDPGAAPLPSWQPPPAVTQAASGAPGAAGVSP